MPLPEHPPWMPEVRRKYEEIFVTSPASKALLEKYFPEVERRFPEQIPPTPEWDRTDYARDCTWLGLPREYGLSEQVTAPVYIPAPEPVSDLLVYIPALTRCTCCFPFPDVRLTMPWCDVHGERLHEHGFKRSQTGTFILLTSTVEPDPRMFEAIHRDLADATAFMLRSLYTWGYDMATSYRDETPVPREIPKPKKKTNWLFGLGLSYADVAHLKERTRVINNDLEYFVSCSYDED